MGYSDWATYIRTDSAGKFREAFTRVAARVGLVPAEDEPFQFLTGLSSYLPTDLPNLHVWTEPAVDNWIRVYMTIGSFLAFDDSRTDDSYVPGLQRVAALLRTDAFTIEIHDSTTLHETDGERTVLTGLPESLVGEVYWPDGDYSKPPLKDYRLPSPYRNVMVVPEIIPELIGYNIDRKHDFKNKMPSLEDIIPDHEIIPRVEQHLFGRILTSTQEFFSGWYGGRTSPPHTFSFVRQ